MFPDVELVRSVQQELDKVIEEGVGNIVQVKIEINFRKQNGNLVIGKAHK
jgi:hypothetical protein